MENMNIKVTQYPAIYGPRTGRGMFEVCGPPPELNPEIRRVFSQ